MTIHCKYDKLSKPETLKPNPQNPRTHPEREIDALAHIIETTGWRRPVTVSKLSGLIVRGHGAVMAATKLGCKVPVEIQEFADEAEETAHLIADNRLAELACWSNPELSELLQTLSEQAKLGLSGFDDEELERLIAALVPVAPSEFEEKDEDIETEHKCPKCGYIWSGRSAAPVEA